MKALSIQQPWAWLIVHGHKAVENRSWATSYRGPLLIHAGMKIDTAAYDWIADAFPAIALPTPATIARGGIVGRARLVACIQKGGTQRGVDQRLGDPWFFGPWGFVLADATPLPFRPLRGQLGLFEVPDEAAAA